MESLGQHITSSVVDKVLSGGVALLVAYWLNRRIEIFRSRRAFEGEFLAVTCPRCIAEIARRLGPGTRPRLV
jgi:hypothetical protein